MIDRQARRARLVTAPVPGTSLAGYRAIEQRLAALTLGRTVVLVPPLLPPPDPAADGESVATLGRAAHRRGLSVALSGSEARVVAERLATDGVVATVTGEQGPLTVRWQADGPGTAVAAPRQGGPEARRGRDAIDLVVRLPT